MTAFIPATAVKAVALLESAGVPDARRLLADYAAAGLIRTYALVIQTTEVGGGRAKVRGSAIPADLWQRVVGEGATADVWTGGTVRLTGAELIGGVPAVDITGTGFHRDDLDRLIELHCGRADGPKPKAVTPVATDTSAVKQAPVATGKADPAAIPPGAIFATVAQTMAALGFGRTKINGMMNDGRLEKRKIDGATRITVASIMAMAEAGG